MGKNIADILRHAPRGLQLYSTVCGDCTFQRVVGDTDTIVCYRLPDEGQAIEFYSDGRICNAKNAECVLFPGKDNRDWDKWQKTLIPLSKGGIVLCREFHPVLQVKHYRIMDENTCIDEFGNTFLLNVMSEEKLKTMEYASEASRRWMYTCLEQNGFIFRDGKLERVSDTFEVGTLLCSNDGNDVIMIRAIYDERKEYAYERLVNCKKFEDFEVGIVSFESVAKYWHKYEPREINLSNLSPGSIIFRPIRRENGEIGGYRVCHMSLSDFYHHSTEEYYGIPMYSGILFELGFNNSGYGEMIYKIDNSTWLEYYPESRKLEKIWLTKSRFDNDTNVRAVLFAAHINYFHELQVALKFCGVKFNFDNFEKKLELKND